MAVWDEFIPPAERERMSAEWGRPQGLGERAALLVVDMTFAFVDDRYPLGYGTTGWPCVDAIGGLREVARASGVPVVYSRGLPVRNDAERGRWKWSPQEDQPDLGDPTEIVPALAPAADETVVRKRRPSAFFGTELMSILTYHNIDTLIVTGMVTSGCVRATVVDAFSSNLRVIVPEECVADRIHVSHAISLFDIAMKYGDVVPQRAVEDALRDRSELISTTPRAFGT